MTIKHLGDGHLFEVPFDLPAWRAADHGSTWGEVQLEAFTASQAGKWLQSNKVAYRFFIEPKRMEHGDCRIFIPDANEAMRFKLANVGV